MQILHPQPFGLQFVEDGLSPLLIGLVLIDVLDPYLHLAVFALLCAWGAVEHDVCPHTISHEDEDEEEEEHGENDVLLDLDRERATTSIWQKMKVKETRKERMRWVAFKEVIIICLNLWGFMR